MENILNKSFNIALYSRYYQILTKLTSLLLWQSHGKETFSRWNNELTSYRRMKGECHVEQSQQNCTLARLRYSPSSEKKRAS